MNKDAPAPLLPAHCSMCSSTPPPGWLFSVSKEAEGMTASWVVTVLVNFGQKRRGRTGRSDWSADGPAAGPAGLATSADFAAGLGRSTDSADGLVSFTAGLSGLNDSAAWFGPEEEPYFPTI